MPTVLFLDDFTCSTPETAHLLSESGYRVLQAADNAAALELAGDIPLGAVILNCQREPDNSRLLAALRILQPQIAVLMFSGYCGVPCHQLHLADACLQKSATAAAFLPLLRAVLCQRQFGLCRTVAA